MSDIKSAKRPDYDEVIQKITNYVLEPKFDDQALAYETARLAFFDTLGCGLLALSYPQCTKMLGPMVPGATMNNGVKIPGTSYELDPVRGAFNIGAMVRWLDYNDTWLAAEWGHPSDNLGAIWAASEYVSRQRLAQGQAPLSMKDILKSMIMAHEIQGVIALDNAFNAVGLDHVLLVRIASTALSAKILGLNPDEIKAAVSNAWVDGSALRTYRHAPNAGSRKSWAAGDASARGLQLSLIAAKGEMGYPSALSAKIWGFQDASNRGKPVTLAREFGSYVMENVLFKVSYPAEFHAQTAVECATKLYPEVKGRLADISLIKLETQESAVRIIDKTGELNNPADRDHCLQYMVAVPLITGGLEADHYEDDFAANPLIDELRAKMEVVEDKQMTVDYLDPAKRAIGNAIQIVFKDGSSTEKIRIDYPLGHKNRRSESVPVLNQKFKENLASVLSPKKCAKIEELVFDMNKLTQCSITDFSDLCALY